MKELSFFIFMAALFFGLSIFLHQLLNPKHPDRIAFYIPSRPLFNLLWGSIFYIGYGILIYPNEYTRFILGLINGLLLVYVITLIRVQNFLLKPNAKGSALIIKIINHSLDKARQQDSSNPNYSLKKSLKILGLPSYTAPNATTIQQRLNRLKTDSTSGKISHPYLKELILKIETSLLNAK